MDTSPSSSSTAAAAVASTTTLVFGPYLRVANAMGLMPRRPSSSFCFSSLHQSSSSKFRVFKRVLLIAASTLPVLVRTVHLGSRLDNTKSWDLEWSYSFINFLTSAHALVALLAMLVFDCKRIFPAIIEQGLLGGALNNQKDNQFSRVDPHPRRLYALLAIVPIFSIYSTLWYIVALRYTNPATAIEDEQYTWWSWCLHLLDALVMLWSSLLSSVTLVLLFLMTWALYKHYSRFYQQLRTLHFHDEAVNEGTKNGDSNGEKCPKFYVTAEPNSAASIPLAPIIVVEKTKNRKKSERSRTIFHSSGGSADIAETAATATAHPVSSLLSSDTAAVATATSNVDDPKIMTCPSSLASMDSRLIDFLAAAKRANDATKLLISVTFMVSVSCYVVAVVSGRLFESELALVQRMIFYNWTATMLLWLAVALIPLAKLSTEFRETKNFLLLKHELWHYHQDSNKPFSSSTTGYSTMENEVAVARNMVMRITLVNHQLLLFSTIPVCSATLNMLVVVVPHLIDYVITPRQMRHFKAPGGATRQ